MAKIRAMAAGAPDGASSARSSRSRRGAHQEARKARMQKLDLERFHRRAASGAADSDRVREYERRLRIDIDQDDVAKRIRAAEARAVALSGIEAQLATKRRMLEREAEQEAKAHELAMAIRAAREAEAQELAEAKARQRAEFKRMQSAQIASRQSARLLDAAMRDQEAEQLRAQAARDAEQHRHREAKRRQAMAARSAEAQRLNRAALELKRRKMEAEAQEDARMVEIARLKGEIEAERVARQAREKREASRSFAPPARPHNPEALRVEKEEALRLRKHQAEKTLAHRRAEAAERAKREAAKREMLETLDFQTRFKARQLEKEQSEDALHLERMRVDAEIAEEKQEARARARAAEAERYKAALREQIVRSSKTRDRSRLEPLREKEQARLAAVARANLLEQYKADTVGRLRSRGVPEELVRDVTRVATGATD
ncbi:hypothetical protein FNF31_02722 [Cafeteria roenbergensis]|uniref:Cilia- and flagella-associated protein 45 n=2 Tax=Cafeteria roenbergensis TaxID=33653 RepID=A0A5A8DGV4_CAFRO|nr:hypothetical protein FNF31_02722 [Cafeteria roenbergensis]